MNITSSCDSERDRRGTSIKRIFRVLVLVAFVFASLEVCIRAARAETLSSISTSVLEQQYGIRIILIAVTAGGGMVDFRFKIVDPEKAQSLFSSPGGQPVLLAGGNGTLLHPSGHAAAGTKLKKDAVDCILYPNTRNAVRSGIPVSAAFGSIRVEPIMAQ